MLILWCGFLLMTHFLCHVHPLECNQKHEYEDTRGEKQCCKKCEPGKTKFEFSYMKWVRKAVFYTVSSSVFRSLFL